MVDDDVLALLAPRLSSNDQHILASLSKTLFQKIPRSSILDITLQRSEAHDASFVRWLVRNGHTLRELRIINAHVSSTAVWGAMYLAAKSLTRLTVDVKGFQFHPTFLDACCALTSLDITCGTLVIPEYTWNRLAPTLRTLRLASDAYKTMTMHVATLPKLQTLVCTKVLPVNLSAALVPALTSLTFRHLRFESILPALSELTTLRHLAAPLCRLTYIPDELEHLTALESIDMSWNALTGYTPQGFFEGDAFRSIHGLQKLRSLNISHNDLDMASMKELGDLSTTVLESLDISCNPCAVLPETGAYLRSLKSLTSSFVPRAKILAAAPNLDTIQIHGPCSSAYEPPCDQLGEGAWRLGGASLASSKVRTLRIESASVPARVACDVLDLCRALPSVSLVM